MGGFPLTTDCLHQVLTDLHMDPSQQKALFLFEASECLLLERTPYLLNLCANRVSSLGQMDTGDTLITQIKRTLWQGAV